MANQHLVLVRKSHSSQEAHTLEEAGAVCPMDLKGSINIPHVKHKHPALLSVASVIPRSLTQLRPNLSLCPPEVTLQLMAFI